MTVKQIGRSFSAHPAWLAGALLTFAALSVIGWYLGSPLFVRTYRNEALPSRAPSVGSSSGFPSGGQLASPTEPSAAAGVLRSGELRYVDAIHNGKGPVGVVEVGGQRFVRFEEVTITNAPGRSPLPFPRDRGQVGRGNEPLSRGPESDERLL